MPSSAILSPLLLSISLPHYNYLRDDTLNIYGCILVLNPTISNTAAPIPTIPKPAALNPGLLALSVARTIASSLSELHCAKTVWKCCFALS